MFNLFLKIGFSDLIQIGEKNWDSETLHEKLENWLMFTSKLLFVLSVGSKESNPADFLAGVDSLVGSTLYTKKLKNQKI